MEWIYNLENGKIRIQLRNYLYTISVAIMYKDIYQDTKFVQKDEYHRWLWYKDKLTTKFSGIIDKNEILPKQNAITYLLERINNFK